jgi:7-carboxy-7-deazaguanine synthase
MIISEIFYSLQGEGINSGLPTVFVRTAGCNLRCTWCDTQFAYEGGGEIDIAHIVSSLEEFPVRRICITGGEPLLQEELPILISRLLDNGYEVSLETNGSKSIRGYLEFDPLLISLDIKCPQSKMQKQMDFSNIGKLRKNDQLKFVIVDEKDYKYAKNILQDYDPICNVIMMPVGGMELKNLAEWVLRDGINVRAMPQLHKIIWGDIRGV